MHTSSTVAEGLQPVEPEILEAGGLSEDHQHMCLKAEQRSEHNESETGKAIPTQGKKLGTGCVSSLSLGKEVFQAQNLFFMWPRGWSKDCT